MRSVPSKYRVASLSLPFFALCAIPQTGTGFNQEHPAQESVLLDARHRQRNSLLNPSERPSIGAAEAIARDADKAGNWTRVLKRYREPSSSRSAVELLITIVPLVLAWIAMWAALHFVGYWLALLIAVPAAGLLVRLFMIQHDCGHGAFFANKQ